MEKLPIRIPSKDSKPIRPEGKFTIYQSPDDTQFKAFTVDKNSFKNRALNVEEKTDAIQKPAEKLKLAERIAPEPVLHWTAQGYGDPKKSVITADNRPKWQREQDDEKTKQWLAAEHKKDIDQKVMNYMVLPAAIGVAQITPAAPVVNAGLFAYSANNLYNQYQNGTLGLNLETGANVLGLTPFTPTVLRTAGKTTSRVVNSALNSKPMIQLYRNYKPARDWRLGLEFNRNLGVPSQQSFTSTANIMLDLKELRKNIAFRARTYKGYQLKSLMYGNPLEKQLSKTGTLNTNNIIAYANTTSPMEKQIILEVLNNKFADYKNINYADFKKAVQERLIGLYERVPQSKYADYGLKELNYNPIEESVKLNTFTFKSPRIMSLSDVNHYPGNPVGHSRTFVFPTEPNILYVMESQSDWAQNIKNFNQSIPTKKVEYSNTMKSHERTYDHYVDMSKNSFFDPSYILSNLKHFKSLMEEYKTKLQDLDLYSKQLQDPAIIHLQNNYLQRQLQENLRYAAEQGHTKMRYPTRESAVKIEGYTPVEMPLLREWSDGVLQYAKTVPKSPYTPEIYKLSKKLEGITDKIQIDKIQSQLKRAKAVEQRWLNGEITYPLEHETILNKYSDFPKLYEKLFKNQEVKIVTDPKGNTWYEVDVPKNYLNMEWQYKRGGRLISKNQTGNRLDIKGLQSDPEFKKDYNLYINPDNIAIINDSLINRGANNAQIGATLTQIISESGGDTKPHGNGAYGLVGWRGSRAKNLPKDLPGQTHKLMVELFENHKDWTDGGPGMNINTGKEMQEFFKSGAYNNYRKANNALMNGYVRPPLDQRDKRSKLVQIVKKYIK